MDQQKRVDLLLHSFWRARAQGLLRQAHVAPRLVKTHLHMPPPMGEHRQVCGRVLERVTHRGDQPGHHFPGSGNTRVREGGADDAHQLLRPMALVFLFSNPDQVASVAQGRPGPSQHIAMQGSQDMAPALLT
jgi:sirohydrochlorin ferrochelatase